MSKTTFDYVGPFQGEQHVNLANGVATTQDRKLEVDGEDVARLLEQPDNWKPATKTKGA